MMRTSASFLLANLLVLSTIEVNSLLGFSNIASSRLAYNHHMVATMQPPVTIHPTQSSVVTNDAVATNREKLPWSKSINPDRDLSYMPMFQAQLDLMRSMGMEEVSLSETLVYRSSSVKPARIGNACFKNDKFRKVRLTYFDAGDNVQVQNVQLHKKSASSDLKSMINNIQLISVFNRFLTRCGTHHLSMTFLCWASTLFHWARVGYFQLLTSSLYILLKIILRNTYHISPQFAPNIQVSQ